MGSIIICSAGLETLRASISEAAPEFVDRVEELQDWKQISVLSVESDRLPRWYRPGLLLIGDAAHVMSPAGGVGINYAIQDAVVTANLITDKLKNGTVQTKDLAKIQRRRELPTRIIQRLQTFLQENILVNVLSTEELITVPLPFRLLTKIPIVRDIPARMMAFGPFPVHLKN